MGKNVVPSLLAVVNILNVSYMFFLRLSKKYIEEGAFLNTLDISVEPYSYDFSKCGEEQFKKWD